QLGELRERGPKTDADKEQLKKLEADRNAAQAEVVKFHAGGAGKGGPPAGKVYDLAQIQKQIPDDAALVAWVDLPLVPDWNDRSGDHWACLLKKTGEPIWVQLRGTGPEGTWTKNDDRLAIRFRNSVKERNAKGDWKDLKEKLARQRLAPLNNDLKGIRH